MKQPHIEHIHVSVADQERSPRRIWLVPMTALLTVILVGGTLFSYFTYQAGVREAIRVSESIAYAEYLELKALVDIDTFYEGISINGIALGGKTREEAADLIQSQQQELFESVAVKLQIDDHEKILNASDIGLADDSTAILEQAWLIGRTSDLSTDIEQVHDRYIRIQTLAAEPVDLNITETFDASKSAAVVREFVESQQIEPQAAKAINFNPATTQFKFAARVTGHWTDPEAFLARVIEQLQNKNYQAEIVTESEKIEQGMTADELRSNITLLGTATTNAVKVDPPRDNNLSKACEYLNATVIQPQETFSFNKIVGKRTAERGFLEAGAILDGILKPELGGGVCQITTTVMQAAMMSDFQLVERSPHSWPSSYTKVGLDATINWGGPDFKFKNNSDYPVAIVATYVKPVVTVQVYGRKMAEGVSISLKSVHEGYIAVDAPLYRDNPELVSGQLVKVRDGRKGQRATAYRVYSKNGEVFKETVLFKSYYRPIQGIYDVGTAKSQVQATAAGSASLDLND